MIRSALKAGLILLCSFSINADELQNSSISLIDTQFNNTTWAASNLLDADGNTHWLSSKQINDINFDMAANGENKCLAGFNLTNYGRDNSSLQQFVLLATTDGTLSADKGTDGWQPIVANANPTEKIDYLSWAQGARLVTVDSQLNNSTWSANNINDGSPLTQWLSTKANNVIEYSFDTDWNGVEGDGIPISEIEVVNYGNNDRSVKNFQLEVTTDGLVWNKVEVPGSTAGEPGFVFTRAQNGGKLGTINSQLNNSSWAASNLQDGDSNSRWLSSKSNNSIEFTFDPTNNNTTGAEGDLDDLFTIKQLYLENYGVDDRSVREFQVEVQTLEEPNWQKITPPDAVIGEDYNFALTHHGAALVEIDSQLNTSSWAAKNIHDGDTNSRWLSTKGNNTLAFQFDVDEDGVFAEADDWFSFDRFYLKNYGNDDRSINAFQIAVKTATNTTWQKLKVPGPSSIGASGYNFALGQQGGTIVAADSQLNSSSYAAANLNDGDTNNLWLSSKSNNTIDFQFDPNEDGTTADANDLFTLTSFELVNHGVNDRAIKNFQIEVKTSTNPNWVKIPVAGTSAGAADYPFSLAANGASLSLIDSEYSSTTYAARNIHDGDVNTSWLSTKQENTLAFTFDSNLDGISGDGINLNKIAFVNYGNNDISVQTFEIDIQVSNGSWQTIDSPSGGSIFNATMDSNEQIWLIDEFNDVTAVRLRTLSNFGDNSYTGAKEITFFGNSTGPSFTYLAAMNGNGEVFQIELADQPNNVTDVRLRTISNYGDPAYIGAKELKLLGPSVTENYIFNAAMNGNGETFVLDSADVPTDVTDVKLITINNHGDPSYTGAAEFKLIGPSTVKSKTFSAAMNSDAQLITLAPEDIAYNVTAVKLVTINNHGDASYTGLREFAVIGDSVTPSYTFTLEQSGLVQHIILDVEDTFSDVVGVRINTINNHGDASYTGLSEFKLLGTPFTPSYIFTAENITNTQQFDFDPIITRVLRFHSLNNFGSTSYVRASDFGTVPGVCKTAQWQMDELSYNGSAGEVLDSTGSGYNGVAIGFDKGDNPATSLENPAIPTDPGTCRYATFDGTDDYMLIESGGGLDGVDALSISAWIKPRSLSQSNRIAARGIFSQGSASNGGPNYAVYFDNRSSNRLTIDIDGSNDSFVSNTVFNVDTWYHISLVFDGNASKPNRVNLYVNGTLDGTFFESSNNIPDTSGDFLIGSLHSIDNKIKVFDGAIDEVNVTPKALSQSEVIFLMNNTRPCSIALHHIELEHDGSGLTCSAETITLKACADADCTSLVTTDTEVTLSTSSANSNWSQNPVVIPAGQQIQVELSNTVPETISLMANPDVNSQFPMVCNPSCDIEYFNSGFISTLQNHTACTTQSLTIQAVKLSDTSTSCAPAYTGDKNVEFIFNYANPNTGTKLPLLGDAPVAAAASPENRTLNFDANGFATIDFSYEDAGQIDISISDSSNSGLAASTLSAVVSPASLVISSADPNAQCVSGDANCSVFKQAGEAFPLTLTASCDDGTVTPNFELTNIPLSINTVAPLLGSPVSLAVNSVDFSLSDQGVHTNENQAVSEVGVFTITATPPNNGYFGETIPASTSQNIGRFTPAYFELQIVSEGILSSGNSFVYSGQMTTRTSTTGQLSYLLEPEFSITPKGLSGNTLKNYSGQFMKLSAEDIQRIVPVADSTALGLDNTTKLNLTATLNPASFTENAGIINYQFSPNDHFVYTRNQNALVAPFTSAIALNISSITDSDNISAIDYDSDTSNGVLSLNPQGEEVRFGRWYLDNSFGPETQQLSLPMVVQYWNGNAFVRNNLDNFTSFTAPTDFSITDISLAPASTSVIDSGLKFFNNGQSSISLTAPGEGNQGDIGIVVDAPSWLQYDWYDETAYIKGSFSQNPSAIISFGLYRGDDRMIHWREVY